MAFNASPHILLGKLKSYDAAPAGGHLIQWRLN